MPSRSPTRRVQRVPETWPVLHLETEVPAWRGVTVDGRVRHPARFDLDGLRAICAEERAIPVHCVWGWSRTAAWTGVGLATLLDSAGPQGSWVTVRAASDTYSACLPLADAAEGFLAWARDGEDLTDEAGGPLRYLPPPGYWGYKGVKWAARVTVGDRFVPGFWETKVADPMGLIPDAVELP